MLRPVSNIHPNFLLERDSENPLLYKKHKRTQEIKIHREN